jgi:hypothetical protein
MLASVAGKATRRAFLGVAAAGVAGAAVAVSRLWPGSQPAPHPAALRTKVTPRPRAHRRAVPENSLPGDPNWALTSLGGEHEIEGYAGKGSVLTGE